jgi:hypothetical protein
MEDRANAVQGKRSEHKEIKGKETKRKSGLRCQSKFLQLKII